MPELPEVEIVRRGLALGLTGRRIERLDLHRENLRFPFGADFRQRAVGRTVSSVARRAKYLLLNLDNGAVLIAHLGMSGSFRFVGADGEAPNPSQLLHRTIFRASAHDHAVFHLSDGARLVYNDPRRFGFMAFAPEGGTDCSPFLKDLGIEPLEPPLKPKILAERLRATRRTLKAALLDQKLIAGLGNIYVCEALHEAKLSPWFVSAAIADAQAERLAGAIVATLRRAIAAGGSTLKDFSSADGKPGYFQHRFRVYDRENAPCPRKNCSGIIERRVQNARSTFFCPRCQAGSPEAE